uniref:MFS domain-containing protein n=1 Tax=Steinernema glaseri TaxID=37863 RepID=A0A1I7ZTV9_9BILA
MLPEVSYRSYKRRWLVLVAVCLVNFSNAMTWITYAPVTFQTNDFYGDDNAAMFLNAVFMVCSVPFGFLAMWSVDRFGLRPGCLLGAWVNLAGNVLRVISSFDFVPHGSKFAVVMTGQVLAASAQPFIMYLPTKMAALWFPESQRALANTLASMSNPIGIAAMYSISPACFGGSQTNGFILLNGVCAAVAIVTAAVSLGVTSSKPPTPVSASAGNEAEAYGFLKDLKIALTNKAFLVLTVGLGGGVGLFNALYNNLQPSLCVKGYSGTFSGLMGSLLIVSGLIGAALSGIYVDKTKKFTETMKVCFMLAGVFASSLSISFQFENVAWWVALSIALFGVFGFAIYPIGLELGVETTYPVAEATSSGLIIMSGQVQGVIYVFLTQAFNGVASSRDMRVQTCTTDSDPNSVPSWYWSSVAWNVCIIVLILFFVLLFFPKYRRVEYERAKTNEKMHELPRIGGPE